MLPKDCEHHLMWVYTIQMTLDKTTYFCKKKKKLNQNQPVNVMFVYDYICNSMYKMAISAVYIHIGLSNILTFIHEKTVHWKKYIWSCQSVQNYYCPSISKQVVLIQTVVK